MYGMHGMFVCIVVSAQIWAKPFENPVMNNLELFSLITSFVTFFLGQFLFVEELSSTIRIFFSVLIVAFNVCFFAAVLILLIYYIRKALGDKIFAISATRRLRKDTKTINSLKLPPLTMGDGDADLFTNVDDNKVSNTQKVPHSVAVPVSEETLFG